MFSSQLGTLEVTCDAPPYEIVRACEELPFQSPLDVRWCRKSQVIRGRNKRGGISALYPWNWFSKRKAQPQVEICACGQPSPFLHKCSFITPEHGLVAEYRIGQCSRCKTILWEEE